MTRDESQEFWDGFKAGRTHDESDRAIAPVLAFLVGILIGGGIALLWG